MCHSGPNHKEDGASFREKERKGLGDEGAEYRKRSGDDVVMGAGTEGFVGCVLAGLGRPVRHPSGHTSIPTSSADLFLL